LYLTKKLAAGGFATRLIAGCALGQLATYGYADCSPADLPDSENSSVLRALICWHAAFRVLRANAAGPARRKAGPSTDQILGYLISERVIDLRTALWV
jgi:hypothetical protein